MKIEIYSTPICPNCKTVKNALDSVGAEYESITGGESISVEDMQDNFMKRFGMPLRAVPFVVVDNEPIGDVMKFMPWFKEHKDNLKELTSSVDSVDDIDFDMDL